MSNEKKKFRARLIYFLLVLIWMMAIFKFSSEPAEVSDHTSSNTTKTIIEVFHSGESPEEKEKLIEELDPVIRKIAHFTFYCIGGILILDYINTYNLEENKKLLYSIIVGAIYACSDEFHQMFVPGRSGEITDVIIDTMGIATGVCICLAIIKMIHKKINKK